MKSSPVRRLFAWGGLIALVPIGYLVYDGRMSASDGGMKAGLVLLAVFVAVRITDFVLSGVASALERRPVSVERRTDQE